MKDSKKRLGCQVLSDSQVGNVEGAKSLLSRGGGLALRVETGTTPLMRAACSSGECVDALIAADGAANLSAGEKTSGIDARDASLWTAAMCAAHEGNDGALRSLAKAGADLEFFDAVGWTPLMLAAKQGHGQCLEALLKLGCRVERRDKAKRTALTHAAASGNARCVEILAKAGGKIEAVDGDGRSALMWAARKDRAECIKALLGFGAAIDAADAVGKTALMHASEAGAIDAMAVLVDAGASLEKRDYCQRTARECGRFGPAGEPGVGAAYLLAVEERFALARTRLAEGSKAIRGVRL